VHMYGQGATTRMASSWVPACPPTTCRCWATTFTTWRR
jgi:hypothetical protein